MEFDYDCESTELEITIEEYPVFEGDECVANGSCVFINGDRVKMNGSVLNTVLTHLGFDASINYM